MPLYIENAPLGQEKRTIALARGLSLGNYLARYPCSYEGTGCPCCNHRQNEARDGSSQDLVPHPSHDTESRYPMPSHHLR